MALLAIQVKHKKKGEKMDLQQQELWELYWKSKEAPSPFFLSSHSIKGTQGQQGQEDLSQQEGDDVCGLPVAGVEEMRQGDRRESCQSVGTVESIVDPFGSPPLGSNWKQKTCLDRAGLATRTVSVPGLWILAPGMGRLVPCWSHC